jgi:hypothetical protein
MSKQESVEKIVDVLNKYEPVHYEGLVDNVEYRGRYVLYSSIDPEELEKGLKEGRYEVIYLGEYYHDYARWGILMTNDIPAYNGWRGKCEEQGYYYEEGICFNVRDSDVIVRFVDHWIRSEDRIHIEDSYLVVKR